MNRMEEHELRGINHIPMPEISGVAVVGTLEVHEFEISATKSHTVNLSSAQETHVSSQSKSQIRQNGGCASR